MTETKLHHPPAIAEKPFRCPINAKHTRFIARHAESIAHQLSADGKFIEEVSNSYEGEGYHGPLVCMECEGLSPSGTIIATDAARSIGERTRTQFTVVGYYPDTRQRFCDIVEAGDPNEAETITYRNASDYLIIAAVFAGSLTPVDTP